MLGVMATAVVVLAVAVCFWVWCFPDGTKDYAAPTTNYRVWLTSGFAGDSVIMAVNDSIVVNKIIKSPDEAVEVALPAGLSGLLMLTLPAAGSTFSFDLPAGGGELRLYNEKGVVHSE